MYGTKILSLNSSGEDVEELQIRLAGFSGTTPDGKFGPGVEKQVRQFQTDFMKIDSTGIVDEQTFLAIDKFADLFPLNFSKLKCECGKCPGFGTQQNKGLYIQGKPHIEAFHLYEYPGIHRLILWATRAIYFYFPQYKFIESCGYRCTIRNQQKGRTTVNHMGKAIDFDTILGKDDDKNDDMARCNLIRATAVQKSNAQVGWSGANMKSFEPANIAPTWVHYDVREFEAKYLEDRFFCKDLASLNNRKPIIFEKPKIEVSSVPPPQPIPPPIRQVSSPGIKADGSKNLLVTILDLINSFLKSRK